MALTEEQWKEILNAVEFSNNPGDVLEQVKAKLKKQYQDTYQEWERKGFDVHHLFNVSLTINNRQLHFMFTLLHIAAGNGQLDTVKYLVEQKNVDVNQVDDHDYTALHWAAKNGNLGIVKYLVGEKKADINKTNRHGNTSLHLAALYGYLDAVKCLVDEKNVDINKTNNQGNNALHFAVQISSLNVAKILIAHEIKLKGSETQKPDYLVEYRKVSEYWDKCLDEVKKMQEEKIGGNITFYSIWVSKSIDKLACYIRNEQFAKVLERSNYRSKFPIYANDLDYLFKTAKQRVEALNIGEIVIKHFDGLSKGGPTHLHIAEYLKKSFRMTVMSCLGLMRIIKSPQMMHIQSLSTIKMV